VTILVVVCSYPAPFDREVEWCFVVPVASVAGVVSQQLLLLWEGGSGLQLWFLGESMPAALFWPVRK
jgi:hypothetical protein